MKGSDYTVSLEVIKHYLEDTCLSNSDAIIDEIKEYSETSLVVYVKGEGVDVDSPPQNLHKEMIEYGYIYVDGIVNKNSSDSRIMFEYTTME